MTTIPFYLCQDYEAFDIANEDDDLEEFLGLPRKAPKVGGTYIQFQSFLHVKQKLYDLFLFLQKKPKDAPAEGDSKEEGSDKKDAVKADSDVKADSVVKGDSEEGFILF